MKKIISMILVCTLTASPVNVSFAAEVEKGDITSYVISTTSDTEKSDIVLSGDGNIFDVKKEYKRNSFRKKVMSGLKN